MSNLRWNGTYTNIVENNSKVPVTFYTVDYVGQTSCAYKMYKAVTEAFILYRVWRCTIEMKTHTTKHELVPISQLLPSQYLNRKLIVTK